MRDVLDTLIVGQGLAGSALAWHLIHAGQRVAVIDDGHRTSASMVAAGLINPLAGLRFNLRPGTLDWLDAAQAWYADLTRHFDTTFFHPLAMLRLFRSTEQRRFHARRLTDPASAGLLGAAFAEHDCPEPVAAPFGGFHQSGTGYVDLPALLGRLRDWLVARDALIEASLDWERLVFDRNAVQIAGLAARRVVACDGARLANNPWFADLPLAPDQGEILDLMVGDWMPRHIVNAAHWLVPMPDGRMRFGATHRHDRCDGIASAQGRAELLAGFGALTGRPAAARVVAQRVGIRPGTSDRNPLIGHHPTHDSLWVCNGFGARGSLAIPWYTARLAAHLVTGDPLPAEADIARFACHAGR